MGIRHQFSFLHRVGAPAGGRLSLSGLVFWAVCALVLGGFVPAFSQDVGTEIVRDGTIGADASLQPIESPTGVYEIGEVHGVRAGSNLFHSFQSFNIGAGDTARFTANPVPTDNVISRVTGGPSSIFGKIQSTIPGAAFYLLNPKGILFGPEASLDVQGSFHASTADALHMVDSNGNEFLAFSQESLLTTALPVAFGFLSQSQASLTVRGSTLRVPEGDRISLVGGKIELLGGELTARSGHIDIASTASAGEAVIGEEGLDTKSFTKLGDVVMKDGAKLDASESVVLLQGAGNIVIRAGGLSLDSSRMLADTAINSGGTIDIDVRDRFVLTNGSRVRSVTDATGDAAQIQVVAKDVEISGGSKIESSTAGTGKGSNVIIDASRSIVISNPDADPTFGSFANGISSDVSLGADGIGGDIVVSSPSLTLERSVIGAETIGLGSDFVTKGRPGDIRIRTNHLKMSEEALITNNSRSFDLDSQDSVTFREILVRPLDPFTDSVIRLSGSGTRIQSEARRSTQSGANVLLEATDVILTGGAEISTSTIGGVADAGKIDITADRLSLRGFSEIKSDTVIGAEFAGDPLGTPRGKAGDITIQASDSISLETGTRFFRTRISTTTFGAGDGGRISLTVRGGDSSGTLLVDNGVIESDNESGIEGVSAGDVFIDADVVRIENGGLIGSVANFSTRGSAGEVIVGATESMTVKGSDPLFGPSAISTSTFGEGPAGDVRVSSDRIEVSDGGSIDSFTTGDGKGGTIRIGHDENIPIDTRHLLIQRSGKIVTSSLGAGGTAGAAGSVEVHVDRLTMKDGGRITASTKDGIGGTIEIRASESVLLDGVNLNDSQQASRIEAKTDGSGDAGNISIQTPDLAVANGGRISVSSIASSKAGAAGSIFIGEGTDPVHSLTISGGEISAFAVEGPAVGEPREGNITVTTDGLMLMEKGGTITASVESGLGGDITIHRPEQMVMRDGSQILARTDIGTGGRIEISADLFISTPDSVVSADSGVGNDGIVILDAPQINLESQLAALSTDFLNASALLRPACAARAAGDREGSFVIAHRRGMPLSPEGLLQAFDIDTAAPTRGPVTEEAGPEDGAAKVAKRSLAEGESDFRGGRLEEAEEKLAKASAMYAEIGEAGAHSDALRGLAQSQQAQGDHARSVGTLLQALALAEQSKDQVRIAYTYGSLGNAYLALGDTAKAEDLFDRGVAIAEDLDHEDLQSGLLNNLGNLHATKQSYEKAVDAYEQSAKLAHISGEALKETKALSNAARAALDGEIIPQGTAFLQQALDRAQTLSNTHEKIFVLINIAKSYEQLAGLAPAEGEKSLLKAHVILSGAVDLAQEIADIRALSFALGNLGGLYQSKYRYEEALYLIRAALRAAESLEAPELIYRWRWKEGQILWAQGRTEPAIASYRRAVDILEETRQETLSRYGSAEVYFRKAVAPVYLDLVKALLEASEMVEDREMSHRLLINARGTVERFKAAELRDYFRDECVADLESRTTSPESVSQQAAVVYPIILPDRLELLVTLPDGLQRYTVPVKSAKITAKVAEFRGEIQNRNSRNYFRPAQTLYEWLVSPYAKELALQHIDTIVFVPDGPLRTIPMAALHDGKKFLAETYGLVVTPGLAMVDPKPLSQEDQNVLLAGLSEARHNLAALPSVPAELEALSELYGVEPLLNKNFTRSRIEQEMAEAHPSIVHIASHAVFTGDAKTSKIYTYDSHISMDGLSDLVGVAKFREDPLEMLVLSACETAAGDDRAALGLAGVAIRAGARSALGSLWPIADEATSELIAIFYQELKNSKVSKAIALKKAQSSLIEDSRSNRNHPYYWSPFLLIGNWL